MTTMVNTLVLYLPFRIQSLLSFDNAPSKPFENTKFIRLILLGLMQIVSKRSGFTYFLTCFLIKCSLCVDLMEK